MVRPSGSPSFFGRGLNGCYYRFGYLGNGFTMREVDGRGNYSALARASCTDLPSTGILDTTFYYGLLDGKDEQPDYSDLRPMYAWM